MLIVWGNQPKYALDALLDIILRTFPKRHTISGTFHKIMHMGPIYLSHFRLLCLLNGHHRRELKNISINFQLHFI